MRPGFDSKGNFHDFVPHPEVLKAKLASAKLMPAEKETGFNGKARLPMGRDFVPGDKAAEIALRERQREERLRIAVTSETTDRIRKVQLDAKKALREQKDLTPELRQRYTALATAELTDLVLQEHEKINAEVKARMVNSNAGA